MEATSPHRKRVRHFNTPGHAHELTFSCFRRMPLLLSDGHGRVVCDSIGRARARHGFDVVAFVLMPEHVHLLVFIGAGAYEIAPLLFAIKRTASYRIKQRMQAEGDGALERLMVRERPGKSAFRFWQEGPGYDRNITSEETLRHSIQYIHFNPVKRGLCGRPEEWKWSSARQYLGEEPEEGLPRVRRLV